MNSEELVGVDVHIPELVRLAIEEVPEFATYVPEEKQTVLGYVLGNGLLGIELGPLTGELAANRREVATRAAVNDRFTALSGIELGAAYHFGDVLAEIIEQFIKENPPIWQIEEE